MLTASIRQEKEYDQKNWGTPSNSDEVTLSDYHTMIKQAEQGKGISFEQYTKKTKEWLQKNL